MKYLLECMLPRFSLPAALVSMYKSLMKKKSDKNDTEVLYSHNLCEYSWIRVIV